MCIDDCQLLDLGRRRANTVRANTCCVLSALSENLVDEDGEKVREWAVIITLSVPFNDKLESTA